MRPVRGGRGRGTTQRLVTSGGIADNGPVRADELYRRRARVCSGEPRVPGGVCQRQHGLQAGGVSVLLPVGATDEHRRYRRGAHHEDRAHPWDLHAGGALAGREPPPPHGRRPAQGRRGAGSVCRDRRLRYL